ncbi:SUF system Fe-S cluster assembly protein [Phyllobacterium sp. 628]|uniref:SUF system Fe-S cluster assembly protein n=1 Tax=Phyllobacterium sp. 628 TaxID=2718938 RepID=UPI00166266B2|nr:SUF system Fe-S cluster assembly protein [Phyllobacterium sp. 628]QND53055.1 SUF system Fe-S cluster assembly protein [Phyllobacterium sp. 628]
MMTMADKVETLEKDETQKPEAVETAPEVSGAVSASAIPADELARMTDDIIGALKTVYDPEIPADIYELGLVYKIDIEDDRSVKIEMTLTAPGCPVAGEMPGWVQDAVSSVEGVSFVDVTMTFDPPWTPDRMSEEAQVAVGWY